MAGYLLDRHIYITFRCTTEWLDIYIPYEVSLAHFWHPIYLLQYYWLKPQWNITSHLSEWLSSIKQQTSVMEKREPSFSVGGTVNWWSHCGKTYGGSSKHQK